MKKSLLLMTCIGVCALVLAACNKESKFSAGEEMNAEEARAYREKLLAEQEVTEKTVEDEATEGESAFPDICYYTETGGVWHASRSCSYLKNADRVLESSPESAELAGKARPCSRCASNWQ